MKYSNFPRKVICYNNRIPYRIRMKCNFFTGKEEEIEELEDEWIY